MGVGYMFQGCGEGYTDPGPRQFIKAKGRRKAYTQEAVLLSDIVADGRARIMGTLADRAIAFFSSQDWEVEWHTLEFRVVSNGMTPGGHELWRWEVWVS